MERICFLLFISRWQEKKKDRVRDIVAQVVMTQTPRRTPVKGKVGHQDVKTPLRKDVTLRADALTKGGRLSKAAFAQLRSDFPGQNLKSNFIRNRVKWYREELSEGQPAETLSWGQKRRESGRGAQKSTIEVAQKLIDINNQTWGMQAVLQAICQQIRRGRNASVTCDCACLVQGVENAAQEKIHQAEANSGSQDQTAFFCPVSS